MEENRKSFVGEFKDLLNDFVQFKRSSGYKYTTISENLRRFSVFTLNYKIEGGALSKEIVLDWTAKRKSEANTTREHRISDLKQFSLYLLDLGHEVYIPVKNQKMLRNEFVPYIFTHQEIEDFFYACDRIRPHPLSNKHQVFPVLFRLLYCCGLRISEAIKLKVKDIDLDSGIITIRESKFNKDRLIPMAESLNDILRVYHSKFHIISSPEDYLFSNKDKTALTHDNVYKNFRAILWKAGISHNGNGPRLHDFRHSFCVHTLSRMVNKEIDLYCALPILSTYLGHTSISATQRYVRLTAEFYPDLINKVSLTCAYVFPEVKIK
jgi:integrase